MPRVVLQGSRTGSDLWLAWATQHGGENQLTQSKHLPQVVPRLGMREQLNFASPLQGESIVQGARNGCF